MSEFQIIVVNPDATTALELSELIVGNFTNDPAYSNYDQNVLRSYTEPNAPDRLLNSLKRPDTVCYATYTSGMMVGAVLMRHYPTGYPDPDSKDTWRVRRLHVSQQFRGKGISLGLLIQAEEHVKREGQKVIYAEPTPEAAPLLIKQGWTAEPAEKRVSFRNTLGEPETAIVPRYLAYKRLA